MKPFDLRYPLKGSTSEVVPPNPCIMRQPVLCFINVTTPNAFFNHKINCIIIVYLFQQYFPFEVVNNMLTSLKTFCARLSTSQIDLIIFSFIPCLLVTLLSNKKGLG